MNSTLKVIKSKCRAFRKLSIAYTCHVLGSPRIARQFWLPYWLLTPYSITEARHNWLSLPTQETQLRVHTLQNSLYRRWNSGCHGRRL